MKILTIDFERLLFKLLLSLFIILIAIQVAMINPDIRDRITRQESFEGMPLRSEEYLYNTGEMVLQLEDSDHLPSLKILVNTEIFGLNFKSSNWKLDSSKTIQSVFFILSTKAIGAIPIFPARKHFLPEAFIIS